MSGWTLNSRNADSPMGRANGSVAPSMGRARGRERAVMGPPDGSTEVMVAG